MPNDATIIDRLLSDEPAFLSSLDFGPFVAQGEGAGPSLLIGDMSEISLMRAARTSYLDHRMAHLAKSGDVVLVRKPDPRFEAYLKEYRSLEGVTFRSADPACKDPVAKQALNSGRLLQQLVHVARQNRGLTITSYLTTGSIWHLAQTIGERASCTVHVNGPSPRISRRVNDKLWFTQLAKTVVGDTAVPPTMSAYGPKAAVAQIQRLQNEGQQTIVKVPNSAGSAGNIRLERTAMDGLTTDQIESLLMDRLHGTGWTDIYPILVGVWDADVTSSPSVQLWLPHVADGPPVVQGVFEQNLFGETAAFIGAAKSTLPETVQERLVAQTMKISKVLQNLGYYGRCSFDAVICRQEDNPNSIHWIECNGRWSGVSIPLAVIGSLALNTVPKGLIILQERLPGDPIETSQAVNRLHNVLHDGGQSEQGVVLLSPPNGEAASTANLLVFAGSQPEAVRLARKAVQLLRTQ